MEPLLTALEEIMFLPCFKYLQKTVTSCRKIIYLKKSIFKIATAKMNKILY